MRRPAPAGPSRLPTPHRPVGIAVELDERVPRHLVRLGVHRTHGSTVRPGCSGTDTDLDGDVAGIRAETKRGRSTLGAAELARPAVDRHVQPVRPREVHRHVGRRNHRRPDGDLCVAVRHAGRAREDAVQMVGLRDLLRVTFVVPGVVLGGNRDPAADDRRAARAGRRERLPLGIHIPDARDELERTQRHVPCLRRHRAQDQDEDSGEKQEQRQLLHDAPPARLTPRWAYSYPTPRSGARLADQAIGRCPTRGAAARYRAGGQGPAGPAAAPRQRRARRPGTGRRDGSRASRPARSAA